MRNVMTQPAVYLDFNATTPCDPRVVDAMSPYHSEVFGNPASRQHGPGRTAFMALEDSRKKAARALGVGSPTEIVFTSGATEANNLALKGFVRGLRHRPLHIVTQATEHPAVLEPLRRLEDEGAEVTVVGVDRNGQVDPNEMIAAFRDSTRLVSMMLANNETGVVQPVEQLARLAHERGAVVHCDAAQAVGKIPVAVELLGVDLMSVSAHKVYGPKGIGALYVRRSSPPFRLRAIVDGGGHENGLRSGTANVPGAVGFAQALTIAAAQLPSEARRLEELRDTFEARITTELHGARINGSSSPRLPGTSSIAFHGIDGEALMASLPDLAVSTGSACASAHPEPSTVLRAMGLERKLAGSALRISFGRPSTAADSDFAAGRIIEEVCRLRRRR
jgi:cysteine desulfurase